MCLMPVRLKTDEFFWGGNFGPIFFPAAEKKDGGGGSDDGRMKGGW